MLPAAILSLLLLLAVSTLLSSGASAPDPLGEALNRPILEPGTALREIQAFLHQRVPPLPSPTSAEAWTTEAARLRQRLLDEIVFRGVPPEWRDGPTRVEWGERRPMPGYSIRKLRYEAVPGLWIPALLYEPDGIQGRAPAVLNVNGHVGAPGKSIDY